MLLPADMASLSQGVETNRVSTHMYELPVSVQPSLVRQFCRAPLPAGHHNTGLLCYDGSGVAGVFDLLSDVRCSIWLFSVVNTLAAQTMFLSSLSSIQSFFRLICAILILSTIAWCKFYRLYPLYYRTHENTNCKHIIHDEQFPLHLAFWALQAQ
eukprot:5394981-Pleurochrysis_carterae.AAC.4